MKKSILLYPALVCITLLSGCQVEEDIEIEENLPEEASTTWFLTVKASKADGTETKGLEIGEGTQATTTLLKSVWKADEEVNVYLDNTCIGTLTATPDQADSRKATLYGTVTTSGITAGSTRLTFLTPREEWSYTDQVGVLLDAANSIEKKYHYTLASSVLVTEVSGNAIATESASFTNQQSIFRLSFRYQDGPSTKTPITTKSVTISGASGKLVQSQILGGATTKGPISLILENATADPFFAAIRNGNETTEEAFTFTVVDENGVTFRGTKTIPADFKPNGSFVSVKNATLNTRLDLSLNSNTVETAL